MLTAKLNLLILLMPQRTEGLLTLTWYPVLNCGSYSTGTFYDRHEPSYFFVKSKHASEVKVGEMGGLRLGQGIRVALLTEKQDLRKIVCTLRPQELVPCPRLGSLIHILSVLLPE